MRAPASGVPYTHRAPCTPGCDKSKLAGMLEALLAGHPALAPEVRQMLESGSDADDGAGAGTGAGAGAGAQ